MKTAVMHVRVIEFTCPICDANLEQKNGSHMFDIGNTGELPDTLTCECGAELKVPAKAKKLAGIL